MRWRTGDTVILTERLRIEPPQPRDYDNWSCLRESSRDHLQKWEPAWPDNAHTRADWKRRHKLWTDGWQAGTNFSFFIHLQTSERMIGGVSLAQVRFWPSNSATLGYWLGEGFEGQGYMREAVGALCDWGFGAAGLHRIEAATVPENSRSQSVLTACGFEREGYARAYLEINGKWTDHMLFGLVSPLHKV